MSDAKTEGTSAPEIVITRMFDAPRELVFQAYTDSKHIAEWWGPKGFTTTTKSADIRLGGVWRYVMHGPDGRDYENTIVYKEIIPPEFISLSHGGDENEPDLFQTTVTFVARGNKTELTLRSIFPTAEARDFVVCEYDAIKGGEEHLECLAEFLAKQTGRPV